MNDLILQSRCGFHIAQLDVGKRFTIIDNERRPIITVFTAEINPLRSAVKRQDQSHFTVPRNNGFVDVDFNPGSLRRRIKCNTTHIRSRLHGRSIFIYGCLIPLFIACKIYAYGAVYAKRIRDIQPTAAEGRSVMLNSSTE